MHWRRVVPSLRCKVETPARGQGRGKNGAESSTEQHQKQLSHQVAKFAPVSSSLSKRILGNQGRKRSSFPNLTVSGFFTTAFPHCIDYLNAELVRSIREKLRKKLYSTRLRSQVLNHCGRLLCVSEPALILTLQNRERSSGGILADLFFSGGVPGKVSAQWLKEGG